MRTLLLPLLLALCLVHPASGAPRPNVLLILADDLGYSDLGCYGGEVETPHLDRLAKNGVRFSAFYNSARCCPSRASLMTGLHPHQAGIGSFATRSPRRNAGPAYTGHLLPSCATLAELLGDAGYSTWMVGKWHMGIPGPIERGFQNYFGYRNFLAYAEDQWDPNHYVRLPEGTKPEIRFESKKDFYATDAFNDYALEFLNQARRVDDQPWFLYLAHSSPHFPVQAPLKTIDKYVPTYRKGWDILREERFRRQKTIGLVPESAQLPALSEVPVDRDDIANGFPGVPNPHWDSLDADRREDLARRGATFAAMVEHIDRGVGRLLADLKKNGELENTLVLFTSDNGACYEWGPFGFDGPSRKGLTVLHKGAELQKVGQSGTHQSYGSGWANLGNTPLNMYKHFCHEGGITSPLIAHWPQGIAAKDQWVHDPAHIMDLVPTVLTAAGAGYPAERNGSTLTPMAGTSLLASFAGKGLPERTLAFEHQGARGLRKGDWKIVWGKRQPDEVRWELYNLKDDRSEQINLAASEPALTKQLVAEWEEWAKKVGAEPFLHKDHPATDNPTSKFPKHPTPKIKGQPLAIRIEAEPTSRNGVIVAHGGKEHGYALHLLDGHLAFDVRVNGVVTRIKSPQPVTGRFEATAFLGPQKLQLAVGGKLVEAESPGLIPVEPKDGLNVGYDDLTAAGNYEAPNHFQGKIHAVKVTGSFSRVIGSTKASPRRTPAKTAAPLGRAEIEVGLKRHDRALFVKSGWIRDPYIVLAPDGYYYLTGTTPLPDDPRQKSDPYNTGLGESSIVGWKAQIWRSRNLADWESLGTPFTLQDGIWFTEQPARFDKADQGKWRLWAPELHLVDGNWALVHTSPSPVKGANLSLRQGLDLTKGTWRNPMGPGIERKHDPSLFEDEGRWWMLWGATRIAPLKPDFSGFAADPVTIGPSGDTSKMGHEGCLLHKIGGKYVLFGTGWSTGEMRKGSYNLYYATADKIEGPYSERKFAGRFLGHGTPFRDKEGRWWCTGFYNGNVPPLPREGIRTRDLSETAQTINQQGVTLVPLEVRVNDDGSIHIRAKDPDYASPGPDEAQSF